jgi:thiosulfate/3-mercaptopyruvate sulfurtransferase
MDEGPPTEEATHGAARAAAPAAGGAGGAAYPARLNAACVKAMQDVDAALLDEETQVVDARPAPRFRGLAPEPRPEVPPGHMPGAI